jgi:hypothetical protein
MAILKTPVYITLTKNSYDSKPKVLKASGTKPTSTNNGTTSPSIVLKIDLELDDSLFDVVTDTKATLAVGAKNPMKATRLEVNPESVIAGLKDIGNAMKKI